MKFQIDSPMLEYPQYLPPLGGNTPVSVEPFPVDYSVPKKYEIGWVVKRLHNHRSREPSGMRAEHIKGWMAEANNEEGVAAQTAEA